MTLGFDIDICFSKRLIHNGDAFIDFVLCDDERRRHGNDAARICDHGDHVQFTQLLCHCKLGIDPGPDFGVQRHDGLTGFTVFDQFQTHEQSWNL